MANDVLIVSTLTSDVAYTIYKPVKQGHALATHKIVIKGGANVANKFKQTNACKANNVTKEDLELLKQNEVFKRHVKGGFLVVDEGGKVNAGKAAKDMEAKDKSAPLTPKEEPKITTKK